MQRELYVDIVRPENDFGYLINIKGMLEGSIKGSFTASEADLRYIKQHIEDILDIPQKPNTDKVHINPIPTVENPPENEDNWKHRSQKMRCATCMWFVAKVPLESELPSYDMGRCRRRAPTMSGWPVMFLTDWCGDHKLDETK